MAALVDPLARRSATLADSCASRLKAPTALAVISAAVASSICAATANCIVPVAASIASCAVKPALPSCSMASAAPAADTPGRATLLPSSFALAATCTISSPVADVTACILSMLSSYSRPRSMTDFVIPTAAAPTAAPANATPAANFFPNPLDAFLPAASASA